MHRMRCRAGARSLVTELDALARELPATPEARARQAARERRLQALLRDEQATGPAVGPGHVSDRR